MKMRLLWHFLSQKNVSFHKFFMQPHKMDHDCCREEKNKETLHGIVHMLSRNIKSRRKKLFMTGNLPETSSLLSNPCTTQALVWKLKANFFCMIFSVIITLKLHPEINAILKIYEPHSQNEWDGIHSKQINWLMCPSYVT